MSARKIACATALLCVAFVACGPEKVEEPAARRNQATLQERSAGKPDLSRVMPTSTCGQEHLSWQGLQNLSSQVPRADLSDYASRFASTHGLSPEQGTKLASLFQGHQPASEDELRRAFQSLPAADVSGGVSTQGCPVCYQDGWLCMPWGVFVGYDYWPALFTCGFAGGVLIPRWTCYDTCWQ